MQACRQSELQDRGGILLFCAADLDHFLNCVRHGVGCVDWPAGFQRKLDPGGDILAPAGNNGGINCVEVDSALQRFAATLQSIIFQGVDCDPAIVGHRIQCVAMIEVELVGADHCNADFRHSQPAPRVRASDSGLRPRSQGGECRSAIDSVRLCRLGRERVQQRRRLLAAEAFRQGRTHDHHA